MSLVGENLNSESNSGAPPAVECAAPKVAWGGAGIVPQSTPGVMKSSAWGPTQSNIPIQSFRDLQSEDLAKELNRQENLKINKQMPEPSFEEIQKVINQQESLQSVQQDGGATSAGCSTAQDQHITPEVSENATDNDFVLAQMLQYEYDLQHDHQLELDQKQINKNSKLSISYNNRKILPTFTSDEQEIQNEEDEPIDEIEAGELEEPQFPPCGYVQHDGVMVTKHNSAIASRKNAKKMMNFLPYRINTGDAGGFQINMPNKVFNKLNSSINSANRRKQRVHDKVEKGTLGKHLDTSSSIALLSLVNSGVLDDVGGIISTGKEAVVYYASIGSIENATPYDQCVVKVFKTRLGEFKTRERYIREDHRFKDRLAKSNTYSNISLWVEKEYRNLRRIHSAGVSCPVPLYMRQNIIVMSLIGSQTEAAPQLRDVLLSDYCWQIVYEQTLAIVWSLVNQCNLVHADLSEYNLLYYDSTVYVIDFAQAVDLTHPSAFSFLYRDLCNVSNFFRVRCGDTVKTAIELLEDITQMSMRDCAGLSNFEKIDATEQQLSLWREGDYYNDAVFDFLWGESKLRQQIHQRENPDLQNEPEELRCSKTISNCREEWITKKTDTVVIKGQKKKKRIRKNSSSSNKTDKLASATVKNTNSNRASNTDEDDGFCVVESSDCSENNLDRKRQRNKVCSRVVRFDTTEADTEDYNADADTDDLGGGSEDADTDVAVTDQDGDTEGYHGDADDTDNYASDRNDASTTVFPSKKMINTKGHRTKTLLTDAIGEININASNDHDKSQSATDRRHNKKKNRKARSKTQAS